MIDIQQWHKLYINRQSTHMTRGEFFIGKQLLEHNYKGFIYHRGIMRNLSTYPDKSFIYGVITRQKSITKKRFVHLDFIVNISRRIHVPIEYDGAQHVQLYNTCRNADKYMSGKKLITAFKRQLINDYLTEQYCEKKYNGFLRIVNLDVTNCHILETNIKKALLNILRPSFIWFRVTNSGRGYSISTNGNLARRDILCILENNLILALLINHLANSMNLANNKQNEYFGPILWNPTNNLLVYIKRMTKQVDNFIFNNRM